MPAWAKWITEVLCSLIWFSCHVSSLMILETCQNKVWRTNSNLARRFMNKLMKIILAPHQHRKIDRWEYHLIGLCVEWCVRSPKAGKWLVGCLVHISVLDNFELWRVTDDFTWVIQAVSQFKGLQPAKCSLKGH